MNKTKDKQIITILKDDPQQGMELLIETYTGLVFKVISFHLSNPEDIKECINDTFAKFYFCRESYDETQASLAVYLTAIARYQAISRYRKEKKNTENISLDEIPGGDKDLWLTEVKADLSRALDSLKPNELQIIRMKYYGGMSIAEIAQSLQLPYETVKKRHQRSILKLRHSLLLSLVLLLLALFSISTYAVLRHFNIIPPLFSIERSGDGEEKTEDKEEETTEEKSEQNSLLRRRQATKKKNQTSSANKETTEESTEDTDYRKSYRADNRTQTPDYDNTNGDTDNNKTSSDSSSISEGKDWDVPDNFRYVPGYGVKAVSDSPTYTLDSATCAENESTSLSVTSASLINQKLTVKVQLFSKADPFWYDIEDPDFQSGKIKVREQSSIGSNVYYQGDVVAKYLSSSNNSDNYYLSTTTFEGENFEPEDSDGEDITLTLQLYGLTVSFTMIKTEEETLVDDSLYQMKKYGGLMILPRLENEHLKIAIYPLNKDEYLTLPGLIRGAHGETLEGGVLTATDSRGQTLEGSCIRYNPGCNTYFEWDFGVAAPGTYSLHIPFLCQVPAEYAGNSIGLNFSNHTWEASGFQVPGGKVYFTDISDPYLLPADSIKYEQYKNFLEFSELLGIPVEDFRNPDNYTYQTLTIGFASEDPKHTIEAIYGSVKGFPYPSCELPNGLGNTVSEYEPVYNSRNLASYEISLLKDVMDPSSTIYSLTERTKNSLINTPVYYKWDESFDFTFTVK